jgi:tripartite ATP-independent transporter DctM subunit
VALTWALLLAFTLIALLAIRMPIALAMLLSAMAFLLVTTSIPMTIVPQRLWSALDSFPLLAIPYFVLAGILINESGGSERIFNFCLAVVGHFRGGLGHVNVLGSMIFAGMSGSATADAAGLSQIEIDAMVRDGYEPEFAAAVSAASATIGPIIPPSVPLVVYGVMAQVSVWDLFLGGFLPGMLMGISMMVVVAWRARARNYPVHPRASLAKIAREFRTSFLALMAPVVILGGLFAGIFTPTEAGVVASLYALMLGLVYGNIRLRDLPRLLREAALMTAQITFIVAAAGLFGWVVTHAQVPTLITNALSEITSSKYVILILINVAMLVMGTFIDALALLIMMTPVVVPLGAAFGVDPVQLGLIVVLNCMIGLITPPVGLCLYIVANIAKAPVLKVASELVPFYWGLVACLVLLIFFPQIVTILPSLAH